MQEEIVLTREDAKGCYIFLDHVTNKGDMERLPGDIAERTPELAGTEAAFIEAITDFKSYMKFMIDAKVDNIIIPDRHLNIYISVREVFITSIVGPAILSGFFDKKE